MMVTTEQFKELAGAIAGQAEAIEKGTVIGSLEAACIRLMVNAETLRVWSRSVEDSDGGS